MHHTHPTKVEEKKGRRRGGKKIIFFFLTRIYPWALASLQKTDLKAAESSCL